MLPKPLTLGNLSNWSSKLLLSTATREPPAIPPKPAHIDRMSFHGITFNFMEDIVQQRGFLDDGSSPAAVHRPVFLFARNDASIRTCYPEGASNAAGNGPNPGTDAPHGPSSINPGADCRDPGGYRGDYTQGNPFPVYVSAQFCVDQWRIDYTLYYVHDGNLNAGHIHDWEGVSVVFRKDPAATDNEDWWRAHGVIFRVHGDHFFYNWQEIYTVSGLRDVRDDKFANAKNHVKVYVGEYSHASHRRKCDVGCASLTNVGAPSADREYRSSDWYRLPDVKDLFLYSVIPQSWCEDDAPWKNVDADNENPWKDKSNPWSNKLNTCVWNVTPGKKSGRW
ncbi:hypothetical protein BDV96DRAFT_607212 [Lophiotrema nucula]|uniref:Necrosis inducing protein-domain-containing protein n=1 Tax=Lophiotrema nucula TaxID=690887 RepID=A0A6A5YIE1_9PLEO|nr:hypothetical protein BDV96DRAFT_607212 [Lophiotrema nucula]